MMVALWIIVGIILFFIFLLMIKATVTIEFKDAVSLKVSILTLIRIKILPSKAKKVNLGNYTVKKVAKRKAKKEEKERAKALKKRQKKEAKKNRPRPTQEEKEKKPTLEENLNMINLIIKMFFSRFSRHLKIKASRIRITVGTGDAANTAILYGVICQTINPAVMLLERFTNINNLEKADIDILPDFTAESTTVDIKISFSLRVWHLLDIGIRALKHFLHTKINAYRRAARQAARREAVKNSMMRKASAAKTRQISKLR